MTNKTDLYIFSRQRRTQCLWPKQEPEKAQKVQDCVHTPPDLRAGKMVFASEVFISRGPGPGRTAAGVNQCTGHHLVPEPPRQTKAGHGGAESGCGVGQSSRSRDFRGNSRSGRVGRKCYRKQGTHGDPVVLSAQTRAAERAQIAHVARHVVLFLRPHKSHRL